MALNPPIDLLNDDEAEIAVAILRASTDLGAADRELQHRFSEWDPSGAATALMFITRAAVTPAARSGASRRRRRRLTGRRKRKSEQCRRSHGPGSWPASCGFSTATRWCSTSSR